MEDILVADSCWYGATRLIGMIRVLFHEKDLKSEHCGHHHQKPRSLEKTLGLLAKILSDGAVYAGSNISNKTSIKAKYSRFYHLTSKFRIDIVHLPKCSSPLHQIEGGLEIPIHFT